MMQEQRLTRLIDTLDDLVQMFNTRCQEVFGTVGEAMVAHGFNTNEASGPELPETEHARDEVGKMRAIALERVHALDVDINRLEQRLGDLQTAKEHWTLLAYANTETRG